MAALYLASAGAGLGAALLLGDILDAIIFGFSATEVGLVLVLIGIAVALLIELFKANELQEWMEPCLIGTGEGKRYSMLDDEIDRFGVAMQALGFKEEGESEGVSSSTLLPQVG